MAQDNSETSGEEELHGTVSAGSSSSSSGGGEWRVEGGVKTIHSTAVRYGMAFALSFLFANERMWRLPTKSNRYCLVDQNSSTLSG